MRFLGENILFFWFDSGRAKGRGREKSKTYFDDPWSSVGWNSSSQKLNLISLTKAMACVQKMRSFTKDTKEEIWGNKMFWALGGVLEASYIFTILQKVGLFPALVYFYLKGLFGLFLDGLWPFL